MSAELKQRIEDKSAVVGVIGLGYVGLPLIDAFTGAGFRALGFDVDQSKVDALKLGHQLHQAHFLRRRQRLEPRRPLRSDRRHAAAR